MRPEIEHNWDLSPKEAIALQNRLRGKIKTQNLEPLTRIKRVAGCDVSYSKATDNCYAAVVIFSYPDLDIIEKSSAVAKAQFPYIPGLLSFREIPTLIEAFGKIKNVPDALVFDSQGYTHPRRFGLASHAGLLYGKISIGIAKTLLIGEHDEPPAMRGGFSVLKDPKTSEQLGWAVRTKSNCKPMFISPGHNISMEQSLEFVLSVPGKYRMPDITRLAHLYSNEIRLGCK